MASVKNMMNCIGVDTTGPVSILFDFFGFVRGRVPKDPLQGVTARVSLLGLVKSLQGKHFHLNIIRVGIDKFTNDPNADDDIDKIDYAIYKLRNIYRQVDLGVGRVRHWDVLSADAKGFDDIGSMDEAEDMWDEWSTPNDGIDAFVVHNISASDFIGLSPIPGSCLKGNPLWWDGLLAGEANLSSEQLARTTAHEVGHYLGLSHNHNDNECPDTNAGKNNLMAQSRCALDIRDSVLLTDEQGEDARAHCFVMEGC